jgi:hypothetical protein
MPKSRVGSSSTNSVTTSGNAGGVGRKASLRNIVSLRVQKRTCSTHGKCGDFVCGASFLSHAACGRLRL